VEGFQLGEILGWGEEGDHEHLAEIQTDTQPSAGEGQANTRRAGESSVATRNLTKKKFLLQKKKIPKVKK